jgi:hypothetical protein
MEHERVTKLVRVTDKAGNPIPGLFTFDHIERDPDLEGEFLKFVREQELEVSQKPKES